MNCRVTALYPRPKGARFYSDFDKPYELNDSIRINQFKAFFADDELLTVLPQSTKIFELTAEIAPKYKMKLIDALHYSTAIYSGCQFILTNDKGFISSEHIEVIRIKDLLNT